MSTRYDNPPEGIAAPDSEEMANYHSTYYRGYVGDLLYRYIVMDMPIDGYMFGVGEVKHYDKQIPLKKTGKDHPDPGDYALIEQLIGDLQEGADLTALFMDALEFVTKDVDIEALSRSGRLGLNMSEKVTQEATHLARNAGKMTTRLGVVSLTITGRDMCKNGMNADNTADMIFGVVGFIPGVGWVISGIYTVSNAVVIGTTGKSIPQHTTEKVNEFHYKLEMNLRARFMQSMYNIFSWY